MKLALVICAAMLTGCAAQNMQPQVFIKPGTTEQEFMAVRAKCAYEVEMATQATDTSYRTIIIQEMDRAERQRKLARLCMEAAGYRLK